MEDAAMRFSGRIHHNVEVLYPGGPPYIIKPANTHLL